MSKLDIKILFDRKNTYTNSVDVVIDGVQVQGTVHVTPLTDEPGYQASYYIWAGDVIRATLEYMEKFTQKKLKWRDGTNGNGHGVGYLTERGV